MKTIEKMFKHGYWANLQILSTLQEYQGLPQEVQQIFSHILLADRVWLTRLQGRDSSMLPIWTDLKISECKDLLEENRKNYISYLSNFTESDLEQNIQYKNSKGIIFKSSISDILIHVCTHGTYHRGQINKLFRQNNMEPIHIDYISFVR